MTRLVAIDTTADFCSLALYESQQSWVFHERLSRQQAAQLLPQLDRLMKQAGWSKTSIDGVVYGCGPGSFTGIRIAASVAQGIALGVDCGVIALSSLQVLAFQAAALPRQPIWACLDARMQELYFGQFIKDAEGIPRPLGCECLLKPSEIPLMDDSALLCGNGWQTDYGFTADVQTRRKTSVLPEVPQALFAAQLAELMLQQGEIEWQLPELALPVYLRNQVTEPVKTPEGA